MPSLGADMDAGTLVEWLVKEGDVVAKGDIVAVVDTTKSAIEVEVFEPGVVRTLLVDPGTTVPVGTPLALLEPSEGAAPPPSVSTTALLAESTGPSEPEVASPIVRHLAHQKGVDLHSVRGSGPDGVITRADIEGAGAAAPAESGRPRVSPLARRTAREAGVDLGSVVGSGADGAVTVADVRRAASSATTASSEPTPAPEVSEPGVAEPDATRPEAPRQSETARPESDREAAARRAAAMRSTIANLMARSKKEIPHYYLRTTVDMQAVDSFVRSYNEGRPVRDRLLPAAVLLKAAALGIRSVPEMNGFVVDGTFERRERIHLGVAVSLRGGGLVAPAIHDADTLSVPDLMAALKDLVGRTRAGRLRGSEMSDPTITVTNLGDQGVEVVHGVIYPPQVALVGFGTIVSRPWAVDGMLTVRPLVTATLAADHRVSDGHRGGVYLSTVATLLQRPEEL